MCTLVLDTKKKGNQLIVFVRIAILKLGFIKSKKHCAASSHANVMNKRKIVIQFRFVFNWRMKFSSASRCITFMLKQNNIFIIGDRPGLILRVILVSRSL